MADKRPLQAHLEAAQDPQDGRRHPRRALRLETTGALPDGVEANVTIHNLSAAGLLIESATPLKVGDVLAVGLPDFGPVGAEVVWESGNLYGCAFEQALGEAALAAAQLRGNPQVGATPPIAPQPSGLGAADRLGPKLNRLRRERSLTLEQVADALGVSKPTVWAWEKGKARPIPERIPAIAAALGVSEEELATATPAGGEAGLVEECRQQIAAAYGVSLSKVRILIEL